MRESAEGGDLETKGVDEMKTKKQKDAQQLAIDELKQEQQDDDIESAHVNADNILCRLLISFDCDDVVEEYHKIGKWYA